LPEPWSQLSTDCDFSKAEIGTMTLWLGISVILSTWCLFALKGSSDAYGIREELLAVSVANAFFGGVALSFYFLLLDPSWKMNPAAYLILSGSLVSFYVSFVRGLKTYGSQRIHVLPENRIPALTITECLQQQHAFEQLNKHAEKYFFTENIMFLKSIHEYRQCFEKSARSQKFHQFRNMVLSFILSDSPMQVNLSSRLTDAILQFNNESIFLGLSMEEQRKIFDPCFEEIEKLVWANFAALRLERMRRSQILV